MDFNKETLIGLIKEFADLEGIELSDIPNIDLYMDQVTTFFDDKLENWKLEDDDKILTKTMINNYAKADILFPPIKKKYSKEHMVLLIIIYHLKQILSLNDIHTVLSPIIQKKIQKDFDSNNLFDLYEQFLLIQNNEFKSFEEDFSKTVNELFDKSDIDDGKNYTLLLIITINLVISSNIRKVFAEKLIRKFPEIFNKKTDA
ncbi:MAG TPA: DUF1836 domain-containing protein [Defluviitaleaceae bacterium]|nr:DUF1836 domain-containing protein [Defluviitaleaceae bacterium]